MAPKKTVGLRMSPELLQRIEAVQDDRSLTTTIIDLIERGLGIEPSPTLEQFQSRLRAIEQRMAQQDERLTQLERTTPGIRPQPIRSQRKSE